MSVSFKVPKYIPEFAALKIGTKNVNNECDVDSPKALLSCRYSGSSLWAPVVIGNKTNFASNLYYDNFMNTYKS